jgi:tRNA A64-2'-O-ribosylphosphate transferase
LIKELVASSPLASSKPSKTLVPIAPTSILYITSLATLASQPPELRRLVISLTPQVADPNAWQTGSAEFSVSIGPHKIGSRNLRTALPAITDFVTTNIARGPSEDDEAHKIPILVACSTGKDHSIGVALALLCLLFDDKGNFTGPQDGQLRKDIDKLFIRQRLSWIMTAMPDANPGRPTLQSVNSYLMERQS